MTEKDFNRMDPWTLGASMDEDSEGVGALIETPSAILAKIKEVNTLVETLAADVKMNVSKLRPIFTEAWEATTPSDCTPVSPWSTYVPSLPMRCATGGRRKPACSTR